MTAITREVFPLSAYALKGVLRRPHGVETNEAALQAHHKAERLVGARWLGEVASLAWAANSSKYPPTLIDLRFGAAADETFTARVRVGETLLELLVVKDVAHAGDTLTEDGPL